MNRAPKSRTLCFLKFHVVENAERELRDEQAECNKPNNLMRRVEVPRL